MAHHRRAQLRGGLQGREINHVAIDRMLSIAKVTPKESFMLSGAFPWLTGSGHLGESIRLTVRRSQFALAEISTRIQIKQNKRNAENWPQQCPHQAADGHAAD